MTLPAEASYPYELEFTLGDVTYLAAGTATLSEDGAGGCWVASPLAVHFTTVEHDGGLDVSPPFQWLASAIQAELNFKDLTEWFQAETQERD